MKYNDELAFKILLYLEDPPESGKYGDVIIEGYSQEEVSYHIKKLNEVGLIVGLNAETFGKIEWKATDLTFAGHKYLEKHRSELREPEIIMDSLNSILTHRQRLWLEAYYKKQKAGEKVTTRQLAVELNDNTIPHFIPGAFLRGDKVTILGIGLLEPDSKIIKNANKVIQAVREKINDNPEITTISAQEISKISGLNENDVSEVFESLYELGMFHGWGKNYSSDGWKFIDIDERAFQEYRLYENIQQIIDGFNRQHKTVSMPKKSKQERSSYKHETKFYNTFNAPVAGIQQGGHSNTQNNTQNLSSDFNIAIERLLILVENSSLNPVEKIRTKSDIQVIQGLAGLERTPEVLETANSKIDAVKEVISMTADMTSLGMVLIPILQAVFTR